MIEVSAFEAKTHLSELLNKVQKGEHIRITKHKVPVAYLVPFERRSSSKDILKAFRDFRADRFMNISERKNLEQESSEDSKKGTDL